MSHAVQRELVRLLHAARPLGRTPLPRQERPADLPAARPVPIAGGDPFWLRDSGGDGAPLVLLHPWSWTADVAFGQVFASLARDFRVLSFDQRGHGRGPRVDQPLELGGYVADLLGVLDAMRIDRALLCGHSLGGLVAMCAALDAPARVAGIVVSGASACYQTLPRDRLVWRLLAASGPLARRGLGRSLPLRYFQVSAFRHPPLWRHWRWLEAELASGSLHALWQVGRMVGGLDLRAALPGRPPVPAAYVVLEDDSICAPSLQESTARLLGAKVFRLAADHDVPVCDPAAYLAALQAALASLTVAPS